MQSGNGFRHDIRKPLCRGEALAAGFTQRKQSWHAEPCEQENHGPAKRQNMPESRKKRRRFRLGYKAIETAGLARGNRLADYSTCIDNGADPGRSGAQNRQPFFDRSQPGLGKVLRRTPGTKPTIIGRVEDVIRPIVAISNFA